MVAKFIARLLGLWKPHELPEPFRGRIDEVDYDVQPLPRGMVSISIHLPKDQLVIRPNYFRNNEGSGDYERDTGWCINALFSMNALSVDIGSSGDKIEVIFPGEFVLVDKALAEEAAGLILRLRQEATGEEVACVPRRPWVKEADSSIEVDGERVTFEFSSCFVDTDEEAGTLGNLDVMVRTIPSLPPEKITDNLCLEVPGCDNLLSMPCYGPFDGGIEVSFGPLELATNLSPNTPRARAEWRRETANALEEVNLFWENNRETELATIPCFRESDDT